MKNLIRLPLILSFILVFKVSAQTLDAGFVTGTGTGFNPIVFAINQRPDGKILVGGSFTLFNGAAASRIALLNNDGTRDTTFLATADNSVTAIHLMRDKRILIGGAFNIFNGEVRNKLVCLLQDGSIDTSFHYNIGFSGGTGPSYYHVQALAEQADGKILVAGEFKQYDLTSAGHIIRLNSDGTIDSSFNSTVGADSLGIYQVICQPDGKILIAGRFSSYDGTPAENIARLNPDGSLDNSFTNIPGANSLVRGMALQPDGKVIIGGLFTSINGASLNRLARLNSDGTVDSTFTIGAGLTAQPGVVAVHPTGKIIIGGGFTTYNGTPSRRLAVLNADGTIDATFAIGAGFSGSGSVSALYCSADGKVLAGGFFSGFDGTTAGNIVRLNNTNPLPVSLTQFTAVPAGKNVLLKWTTASEINNSGFTIERNINGQWDKTGFVTGKGNSSYRTDYSFTDVDPFQLISDKGRSTVYYRLKQTDFDGAHHYSHTVALSASQNNVQVGPNPFSEYIGFNEVCDMVLYDVRGNEVMKADRVTGIDTDHISSGFYTLKVLVNGEISFHKLIK